MSILNFKSDSSYTNGSSAKPAPAGEGTPSK